MERALPWHLNWGGFSAAKVSPTGSPLAPCLPLHSDQPPAEAPFSPGLLSSWGSILCALQIMAEVMAHVSPGLPVDLTPRGLTAMDTSVSGWWKRAWGALGREPACSHSQAPSHCL